MYKRQKEKLNIYTISQLFNQLVNFQQLIKSMYEFIGHGQLIKVDVIMDCIRMVIDQMMQSIMYDRHDFELQLNRIKEELDKLHVRCADIKIKSCLLYTSESYRLLGISLDMNTMIFKQWGKTQKESLANYLDESKYTIRLNDSCYFVRNFYWNNV